MHFNCPLDQTFLKFSGIDADRFKEFVATGATDAEVADWIGRQTQARPRIEIIKWNNQMREMRLSQLSDESMEYMEDYIPRFVPRNRPIYYWFDVYDLEEERI